MPARMACLVFVALIAAACGAETESRQPGLVGLYFSEPNLTAIKARMVLDSLEQNWDASTYQTTGSSGIWDGFVTGPVTGQVRFHVHTNKVVEFSIGDEPTIRADTDSPDASIILSAIKGKSYPVRLVFLNDGRKDGRDFGSFSIQWSWDGGSRAPIPADSITHTPEQWAAYSFVDDPEPGSVDRSRFLETDASHVVVDYEKGRFSGWPANGGVWSWGDEILVAFSRGWYKHNPFHHSIDPAKPGGLVMARSLDGGMTWRLEESKNLARGEQRELGEALSFNDPNLAIRVEGGRFLASTDRGVTWHGPYSFAGLDIDKFSSRTDYLVNDAEDAFFFLSADDVDSVEAILQDRSFVARTRDGGRNFDFVSWMVDDDKTRSVMPSTVRVSDTHLVSAMRRRHDPPGDFTVLPSNWIDAYESRDDGITWQFLSRVASTDTGLRNGNPPAMVLTDDGRLVVTYAYRGVPYSIRAKISEDYGKTWSDDIILRDDAATWDIGYCRTVVRADGKLVTIYYYSTEDRPEQHIEATIWDSRF